MLFITQLSSHLMQKLLKKNLKCYLLDMASSKSGSSGIVENWLADLTNGDGFLFSSASCIMSFSRANHGDKMENS